MGKAIKTSQQEKDLLMKDLCGRLPYNVLVSHNTRNHTHILTNMGKSGMVLLTDTVTGDLITTDIENVKPYLVPLSSMTEVQKEYIRNRFCWEWEGEPDELWRHMICIEDADGLIDWFNKNHLDWRGLIPMGLANDATGLNIY